MAFNALPCDDIMAQIGKHTIDQRRALDRQYWVDMVRDPIRHLDNRTHTFVADIVADLADLEWVDRPDTYTSPYYISFYEHLFSPGEWDDYLTHGFCPGMVDGVMYLDEAELY